MPADLDPRTDDGAQQPLLGALVRRVEDQRLGVRGIHVHRAGHEDVEHRFVADTAENLYSVSKTVTALAVGIARHEGLLRLEDRLVDHLPVPPSGWGRSVDRITLRHLLTMTSGSPVTCFTDEERLDHDLTDRFLRTDLTSEPGDRFEYSNGSTYMLARVVAQRSGCEVRDYLLPRLFEPLGILNPQWFTCRAGHTWGATGLHLRTAELARIGRLLLERGAYEGRQLVPADWVDALHETWVPTGDPSPDHKSYGLHVWKSVPEGSWRADGAYGQLVLVLPRQRAVLTVTAHYEGPVQDLLRALEEEVIGRL